MFVLIVAYEAILSNRANSFQTNQMMFISRGYYVCFIVAIGLTFFVRDVGGKLMFMVLLFDLFWQGSNYYRLAFLLLIVPLLFFFGTISQKIKNVRLRLVFSAFVFVSQSLFVFKILR